MMQRAMPDLISGFVNELIIPKTRNNKSVKEKGEK